MAVTTLDGLVGAMPGQRFSLVRQSFTPQAVGTYHSLWLEAGIPGAGAAPTSSIAGDVPTNATAGCIPFTNPGGGSLSYVARMAAYATQAGMLFLYDRLLQTGNSSGISATSTSGQTINSTALTRPDANGNGAEAWWQVYVVMGAGATNVVTLSYTNPAGTASQSATSGTAFPTTMGVGRTGPFRLAAGDNGVKSVQTWTNSNSMTSGTMGLVIRRLHAQMPVGYTNAASQMDGIGLGLPRIYDSACLELIWLAQTASSTTAGGEIVLVQG